jgi:hypothetical protein
VDRHDAVVHLPDSALPSLFHAADRASLAAQRRFLVASRLRLGLLVVAAAAGAVPSGDTSANDEFAGTATVVALVGAILVEVWLQTARPERTWYDGRALAESAKTSAWRYAVGGAPFSAALDPETADRLLTAQLTALLRDAPASAIGLPHGEAISAAMRTFRNGDLDLRRSAYLCERIDEQTGWYARKARQNEVSAGRWRLGLLAVESVGVLAALGRVTGLVEFDLAGIVAALGAAFVAWVSLKQHESLARAYSYAANELALAATRLQAVRDEAEWSVEVDNAEEAISREHTMWRASRSSI